MYLPATPPSSWRTARQESLLISGCYIRRFPPLACHCLSPLPPLQVELNNVRSFYKESQKSPFKFFPWKTGNMHFRFLPEDAATQVSPLAPLHNHRRVLGVLGVISCPHTPDVARRYKEFEQQCRAFPDASTIRCFAFDPSDAQITEDHRSRPDLILFPPRARRRPPDQSHGSGHARLRRVCAGGAGAMDAECLPSHGSHGIPG